MNSKEAIGPSLHRRKEGTIACFPFCSHLPTAPTVGNAAMATGGFLDGNPVTLRSTACMQHDVGAIHTCERIAVDDRASGWSRQRRSEQQCRLESAEPNHCRPGSHRTVIR